MRQADQVKLLLEEVTPEQIRRHMLEFNYSDQCCNFEETLIDFLEDIKERTYAKH